MVVLAYFNGVFNHRRYCEKEIHYRNVRLHEQEVHMLKGVGIMMEYPWTVDLPGYCADRVSVRVTSGKDAKGYVFCTVASINYAVAGERGQVHVTPGKNIHIHTSKLA